MTPYELFLAVTRWVHATASVAWIGGGLFYIFVLAPAARGENREPWSRLSPAIRNGFAEVGQLAMFALIASGLILAVDRLTSEVATVRYVAVLAVKVGLSVWAFGIAWQLRPRRRRVASRPAATASPSTGERGASSPGGPLRAAVAWLRGPNLIAVLGLLIILLSDVLKVLAESGLGYG